MRRIYFCNYTAGNGADLCAVFVLCTAVKHDYSTNIIDTNFSASEFRATIPPRMHITRLHKRITILILLLCVVLLFADATIVYSPAFIITLLVRLSLLQHSYQRAHQVKLEL